MVVELQKIIGKDKVSKIECTRVWNSLLEVISNEVKSGGEVKFGSLFKVFKKKKNARKVRNPKNGQTFIKESRYELGCRIMNQGKKLIQE